MPSKDKLQPPKLFSSYLFSYHCLFSLQVINQKINIIFLVFVKVRRRLKVAEMTSFSGQGHFFKTSQTITWGVFCLFLIHSVKGNNSNPLC